MLLAFKGRGTQVYLVSGGFRLMIEPVADQLSIPKENIFANTILFTEGNREYDGFDAEEFTSRAGGKARAAKHIKVRRELGLAMAPSMSTKECLKFR